MTARRVSVIGGGPGGLFAARLLARDHPDWEVTVYERLPPDDTFGFGVGLTPALLRAVNDADPPVHDDLVDASVDFSSAAFELAQGTAELPNSHAGAIGRALLLRLLVDRAEEAGARVEIGPSPGIDDLRRDADLVIAADGVSSPTREQLADELGAMAELGRGVFMWVGAHFQLGGTVFRPATTDAGTFVVHAYPYADGLSSVYVETDHDTLERAGCRSDVFDNDGDSDESSLVYLSNAFREWIGADDFIGNRSRWMSFRTIRCKRWRHENIVVLGDAAATAHPSIGSGTKLALDAAGALAAALRDVGDEPPVTRLDAWETGLRPSVERLQERARRSQIWWESFPWRMNSLSPARVAAAYMSRAGAVSLEQLHAASPSLASQAVADFAGVGTEMLPNGDLPDWVLHQPVAVNGHTLPGRILAEDGALVAELDVDCDDPWGADAEPFIRRAETLQRGGAHVIGLTGSGSRDALLDRLALGERIRAEIGAVVAVASDAEHLDDAVDGIVAGRTDLVTIGKGAR